MFIFCFEHSALVFFKRLLIKGLHGKKTSLIGISVKLEILIDLYAQTLYVQTFEIRYTSIVV